MVDELTMLCIAWCRNIDRTATEYISFLTDRRKLNDPKRRDGRYIRPRLLCGCKGIQIY